MEEVFGYTHPPDRDMGPAVLIVDDEAASRSRVRLACELADEAKRFHIVEAVNTEEAIQVLSEMRVHVLLLDKNLGPVDTNPFSNGIEAIPAFLRIQPHLQILMVTGSKDIQDSVQAMTLGAFGYVTKESPDTLLVAQINQAVRVAQLSLDKIRNERTGSNESLTHSELGGKSKAFRHLLMQAQAVSESNRPVLLLGESGTGKTTVAKLIHESRKNYLAQEDRPFLALNMAALSPELVEGELFGTEPGSYTGALSKVKQGFFELANNGTLFLDEIGEASLELQAKLLKALDDGKFYRVGGSREIHSSFKLICATNRNLEEMIQNGDFREDLYMRISTFPLRIPSLEERKEDIPEIIKAILPRCCTENRVQIAYEDLPQDFIEYVCQARFRGNVRGIEQQLSRLLVLAPKDKKGRPVLTHWQSIRNLRIGSIERKPSNSVNDFDQVMKEPIEVDWNKFPGLRVALDQFRMKLIAAAQTRFETNREVARALKVTDSVISEWLKRSHSGDSIGSKRKAQATSRRTEHKRPSSDLEAVIQ